MMVTVENWIQVLVVMEAGRWDQVLDVVVEGR